MAAGAKRMSRMIRDLLAYSRAGRADLVLDSVDLGLVLQDVVEDLREILDEIGGEVSWGALPTIRASPTLIAQVFANLVGNALKFRGDAPPRVQVSAIQAGGEWIFCVEDNGIGIAEEHQERIFQAFQRLHGPDEIPGSGIGLNICQRIIVRHGGRIWVKSRPGRGSLFRFTIPCLEEAP